MLNKACKRGRRPGLGCDLCKKELKTGYQLDLHKYHSHRDPNIKKWTIKCTLCSFQSSFSTSCYKHGKVHHKLKITFQKIFQNTRKGKINFRYSSAVVARTLRIQESRNKLKKNRVIRKVKPWVKPTSKSISVNIKSEFFPCDKCSFEANSVGGLKRHKLAVHTSSDYQQSKSLESKATGKQLSDDIKKKNHSLECAVCPYKTTKRKYLGNHVKIHPDGPYAACTKCKVPHLDDYSLALHVYKIHHDFSELAKWELRCKVCLIYKTRQKKCASQHSLTHCKENVRSRVKFDMYFLGKYYDSMMFRLELGKIMEDEITTEKVRICCPKCEHVSTNWDSFKSHYKRKHEGVGKEANISFGYDYNKVIDATNCEIYTLDIKKEKTDETSDLLRILNGSASDQEESSAAAAENNEICKKDAIVFEVIPLASIEPDVKKTKRRRSRRPPSYEYQCELCNDKFPNDRHLLEVHAYNHLKETNRPDFEVLFKRLAKLATWHFLVIKPPSSLATEPTPKPTWKFHQIKPRCSLCGVLLCSPSNIGHHAYVHARFENNFDLKVRYDLYFNKEHVDTVLVLPKQRIKKKPNLAEPSSDDSNLPFACDECSFKSEQEEALKKHKKLHWSEEKEKAFKEKKWFACTLCSFHCFDYEAFDEHQKWHGKDLEKWRMISQV